MILRGSICFDRYQERKIDHFESYFAPVDCLTAPEMRLVAFSEKPFFLIDVLTATMRADGVSPGLDEVSWKCLNDNRTALISRRFMCSSRKAPHPVREASV